MSPLEARLVQLWSRLGPRLLPFADAATAELPLPRLLRLSLFQVSVGMATVLLVGTLNRVMIVELGVASSLVAVMVALPVAVAPFRALVGFRSDSHRSLLGWRRVPYLWMGTLAQFGGLAIMPFALLVLTGEGHGPAWVGQIGAAVAFLLVGAGLHTVQTVGLALATDLAPAPAQPKVVALLCCALLLGMLTSGLLLGWLLTPFGPTRLVQVIQGAAVVTMILNVLALWKQEPRDRARTAPDRPQPRFAEAWARLDGDARARRRLVVLGLGTAGFAMQDVLLEPYGGQVLGLPVGATTALSAVFAAGGLAGFWMAARLLERGVDPWRLAGWGAVVGIAAFALVTFAAPLGSAALLALAVVPIGLGGGLFAHCTLTAAMAAAPSDAVGLALGAWGAVQATAAGLAVATGGILRDLVSGLAERGALGPALTDPAVGYGLVYQLEIGLLFATLVAIGPLVGRSVVEGRLAAARSPG
jgi:BCD family chlorophyll transporter-like MFS transporter